MFHPDPLLGYPRAPYLPGRHLELADWPGRSQEAFLPRPQFHPMTECCESLFLLTAFPAACLHPLK